MTRLSLLLGASGLLLFGGAHAAGDRQADARSLHRAALQRSAEFIDHKGRKRLAFHFLRDDEQSSGTRSKFAP